MTDDRVERTETCAVCGEEVEIGGFPPEYHYPLDQSDVPDHKVRLAPNPSGPLACDYECLVEHEGEVREYTQYYARVAPLAAGTARRAAESLAEEIGTGPDVDRGEGPRTDGGKPADGVERSKGLTQDDNDGSGPCDLCNTPSPVYTSRIPVRDDGVVARLCGACESGLEDYFSDTESTGVEQSGGER